MPRSADVELAQALIQAASVSGQPDPGALDALQQFLDAAGFSCQRLPFSAEGTYPVDNLFAVFGEGSRHFCFAGHTDVVPAGDGWTHGPFEAAIADGKLYGRGAVDMKSSIACFAAAAREFLTNHPSFDGRISLLITGDEEKAALNGTRKLLPWLAENGQVPTICLVGEPTSSAVFGDELKVGRRGSLSAEITVRGTQGHVAYPQHADNPVTKLVSLLHRLQHRRLDEGTEVFEPSNLEVVNLHVGNASRNMIPATAAATLNIRFNDLHTNAELRQWIERECRQLSDDVEITFFGDGDAFVNPAEDLTRIVQSAVQSVTGLTPRLSTGGGTSDARFIKDYCPTIEFGPRNATAHKVDECIDLDDLTRLTRVYQRVLELYFA